MAPATPGALLSEALSGDPVTEYSTVTAVATVVAAPAAAVASGAVTSTSVSDTTVGVSPSIAADPFESPAWSNDTLVNVRAGFLNPEPVILTRLPPVRGPAAGATASTTGEPKT